MQVQRTDIVAALRARGLEDRAVFVERQLSEVVDTERNGALLRMLGVDPAGLTPVDSTSAP
jgi:hypothetical protein